MAKKIAKDKLTSKRPSEVIVDFEFNKVSYREVVENLSSDYDLDIDPAKIRYLLNRAPSKFAYWGAVLAKVNTALRNAEDKYEFWFARKYNVVIKGMEGGKYVAETSKRYKVMTDYPEDYIKYTAIIRQLKDARDKAEILMKAYEMQSRTLQTIASSLRAELELQ